MNRFYTFLILGLLIAITLVFSCCDYITGAALDEPVACQQTIINVNAVEAYSLIQAYKDNPDFTIIDVRTLEEYNNGHIENTVLISSSSPDFREEIGKLDRSKKYLIYCRSGGRSSGTRSIMEDLGFCYIYHLDGGITGWLAQDYPVVK